MKALLPVSAILFFSMNLKAEYIYGNFYGTVTTFCHSEIHTDTDTLSDKVLTLSAGTELQVLGITEVPCTLNGLASYWYEVSYQSDSIERSGYIPGTWLACTNRQTSDNTQFLYAVTGYDPETSRFTGTARLVTQGETVTETSVEPVIDYWSSGAEYSYSISSESSDPGGFSELSDIFLLYFTYEACGYENRVIPVFNTGTQLIEGPSASSMYEAGIFHSVTDILLPWDPEVPENTLVLRTVTEEWNENTDSYDTIETRDRLFHWSGREFEEI